MATEPGAVPSANPEGLSLDERIEATMSACHMVDPRRIEEVERMRADVRTLVEAGDGEAAASLTALCLDYIRQGGAAKE